MAGVTALRDAARAAIAQAGGRGFVRFLSEGDALLISDAPRRCACDADAVRLAEALDAAGFTCANRAGLLYITPTKARLCALCDAQPGEVVVDWDGPRYGAQALCARLLREPKIEIGEEGFRLMLCAARLLWQPEDKILAGLSALRASAAAMLRAGKRDGMHETGLLLCGWLADEK